MSSPQPSQKRPSSGGDINAPSASAALPQTRPLAAPSRRSRPRVSAVVQLAEALKFTSALLGLVAAVMFVRPLLKGELDKKEEPKLLTLKPSSAPSTSREPADVPVAGRLPAPTTVAEPSPAPTGVQENRTAFKGALLMIDSEPSGAAVRVNGINQGEAPVTLGLDCTPGTTLNIAFNLKGYETLVHHTTCPKDALVKVMAQLHPGSSASKPTGKTPGKRRAAP